MQVSEAEATARTAFLIDCDSDTEGASYSSTVHDRYERAEQGRYDSATGDRYNSVQAFGRGIGNGRGVGAGIGGAAAAAASGLVGPADASLARPHAVPHAVEDQQIRHEEKQLDELVALLERERAGGSGRPWRQRAGGLGRPLERQRACGLAARWRGGALVFWDSHWHRNHHRNQRRPASLRSGKP